MERFEQYEIWIEKHGSWELAGAFVDLEVASAMARVRSSRVQLVHSVYDRQRLVSREVLAELGATREA